MRKAKKTDEEIIHSNPWWIYKHDKFEKEDGTFGDYFYAQTKNSAMIIPVLDDGRVILIRQYRYLQDKEGIEFPCGQLREGEAPSEGAKRELLEETGYKVDDLIKVGNFDGFKGFVKDETHLYLGADLKHIDEPHPEESEDIEVIYRRVDELEQMVIDGKIWDGQTLAAWALVRDHLFKMTNG